MKTLRLQTTKCSKHKNKQCRDRRNKTFLNNECAERADQAWMTPYTNTTAVQQQKCSLS